MKSYCVWIDGKLEGNVNAKDSDQALQLATWMFEGIPYKDISVTLEVS